MSNKTKIIDNLEFKETIEQIDSIDKLNTLYQAIPFSQKIFPKLDLAFSSFSKIKKQASIVYIPDSFNELFSKIGWVAYESMSLDVMKISIALYETEGEEKAEEYLASSYDEETIRFGITRFNSNNDFRKRIRLVELAKEDYLSERYHACIPLLLSLLDGVVNDVSKHVGFFAKDIDLTVWNSIAAHESGLQSLAPIMAKGINKTNELTINIPYRNGILHGRELAFDNKIVAAKCWAALFAARDWAGALDGEKNKSKLKEKTTWKKLFAQMADTNRLNKAIEAWRPRNMVDIHYLPFSGDSKSLPEDTPEYAVSIFLEHWCNNRFKLIGDMILYITDITTGQKTYRVKQDFGERIPDSFKIISIDDKSAAITEVLVEIHFNIEEKIVNKEVSIRVVYQDSDNNALVRSMPNGEWKIMQNSLSTILYSPNL